MTTQELEEAIPLEELQTVQSFGFGIAKSDKYFDLMRFDFRNGVNNISFGISS
jgi:hypothetical protein